MNPTVLRFFIPLILLFPLFVSGQSPYLPPDLYGESPGTAQSFWHNAGQLLYGDGSAASEVKYYTTGQTPNLYCLDDAIAILYSELREGQHDTLWRDHYRVDLSFPSEAGPSGVVAVNPTGAHMNVYKGNLPSSYELIDQYKRVVYEDVYPDVDFHLYGNAVFNKMALVLHPGADADAIRMQFDGQNLLNLAGNNQEIELHLNGRDIRIPQAVAYEVDGQGAMTPLLWSPSYTHLGSGTVDLTFGPYDDSNELVILFGAPEAAFFNGRNGNVGTPPAWMTYFGGSSYEEGRDVVTDPNGNLYGTGWMESHELQPIGATVNSKDTVRDVFVVMFDSQYRMDWITYLGGVGNEEGWGIAWTGHGVLDNIYVVGSANNPDFFLQNNPSHLFNSVYSSNCGFWSNFEAGNGTLIHSSFIGGTNSPALSVAADPVTGEFVIGGITEDLSGWDPSLPDMPRIPVVNNSPATGAYFQTENAQNLIDTAAPGYVSTNTNANEGYFMLMNPNGTPRLCSFFGGDGYEVIRDVAMDPVHKKVYLTGATYSQAPDSSYYCTADTHLFKLCPGPAGAYFRNRLNTAPPNDYFYPDGFIARMSYDGELEWCTYLGGQHTDGISSVAVNSLGEVGVTGYTTSRDTAHQPCDTGLTKAFPTCFSSGEYGGSPGGDYDLFFSVFDTIGALQYSITAGGEGRECRDVWGNNELFSLDGQFPKLAAADDNRFWIHYTTYITDTLPLLAAGIPVQQAPSFYWQQKHADLDFVGNNNNGLNYGDGAVMAIDAQRKLSVSTHFGGVGVGGVLSGFGGNHLGDWAGGIATHGDAVYLTGGTYSYRTAWGPWCPPGSFCRGDTLVQNNSAPAQSAIYFAQLNEKLWPVSVPEPGPRYALPGLEVFPNPAVDRIRVLAPEAGRLILTNALGQTVQEWTVSRGSVELLLDGTAPGNYLLQWSGAGGAMAVEKLVIGMR